MILIRFNAYIENDLCGLRNKPITMGDYQYTELSYKFTSLTSRTCCLGSSGLTCT